MAPGSSHGHDAAPLSPDERERLDALRAATSLADLVALTGADSEHEAYFAAKREWAALQGKRLAAEPPVDVTGATDGIPGDCVELDGHTFCVHGITHADTQAEGDFLREHVSRLLEAGATVYCEQGIRPMYFDDFPEVCAMDDYRWALNRCRELDIDSHLEELSGAESGDAATFDGLLEDVDSIASQFRDAAFALIDSGSDVYGERFAAALGDVATEFLTSHEAVATGEEFESFRKSRAAATDPGKLPELQDYYRKAFLPQPVEREWLRRHDRELELVTHARNERMADYARYHNEDAERVHLVVGAAHQPGVVYYLERHRDGDRTPDGFEPVG